MAISDRKWTISWHFHRKACISTSKVTKYDFIFLHLVSVYELGYAQFFLLNWMVVGRFSRLNKEGEPAVVVLSLTIGAHTHTHVYVCRLLAVSSRYCLMFRLLHVYVCVVMKCLRHTESIQKCQATGYARDVKRTYMHIHSGMSTCPYNANTYMYTY